MNTCAAITKKGLRCKNKTTRTLCYVHDKVKAGVKAGDKESVKPSVKAGGVKAIDKPSHKPQQTVKLYPESNSVFNPYYNKYTPANGIENCGVKRPSLKRFVKGQSNIAFANSYCDVLPLKDIRYIVGPISYTEFRYGKYNIGIFGEIHMILNFPVELNNHSTLNFSSFLASVITQNPKQFDFFFEMYFRSSEHAEQDISPRNTIFNLVSIDFKDCLAISKACPYKNLRAHYSDYRSVSDIDDHVAAKIYGGIGRWLATNRTRNVSLYLNIQETKNLIDDALKHYVELQEKIRIFIKRDRKINKQLDNTPLKAQILKFAEIRQHDSFEEFVKFIGEHKLSMSTYNIKTLTEPQITILLKFAIFFIDVYNNLMDTYTLARMFRTFYKTPADDPENIIVYAGGGHARYYTDFLNYINADKIIEINTTDIKKNRYIEFSEENKYKSFLFK